MNRPIRPNAPRAVFVVLALTMTLASARFIDYLATDYTAERRTAAEAHAAPLQTAALREQH